MNPLIVSKEVISNFNFFIHLGLETEPGLGKLLSSHVGVQTWKFMSFQSISNINSPPEMLYVPKLYLLQTFNPRLLPITPSPLQHHKTLTPNHQNGGLLSEKHHNHSIKPRAYSTRPYSCHNHPPNNPTCFLWYRAPFPTLCYQSRAPQQHFPRSSPRNPHHDLGIIPSEDISLGHFRDICGAGYCFFCLGLVGF